MSTECILDDKEHIAKRLKETRIRLGYTQERFSELLGITVSAYKKIESGDNQISVNGLKRMKRIGVSSDFIIFGEEPDEADVWEKIQLFSEEKRLLIFLKLFTQYIEGKKGYSQSKKDADEEMKKINKILDEILCFREAL